MADDPTKTKVYFGFVTMVTFAGLVFSEHGNVLADFLFSDDGFWISTPLQGIYLRPQNYEVYHYAIFLISKLNSIPMMRVALVFMQAISAGILFLIFRQTDMKHSIAGAASIFCVTVPVFTLQHVFISASHMIAGLPFLLLGILSISRLKQDQHRNNFFLIVSSIFCFTVAAYVSPVYSLASLLTPLGLALGRVSGSARKNVLVFIIVLGVVGIELVFRLILRPHFYSTVQGWTDFSLSHVLSNLAAAIQTTAHNMANQNGVASLFLAIGLTIVLLACILGFGRDRSIEGLPRQFVRTGLLLLAASALTFGPATVVRAILDRYCLVPAILGFSSIICFVGPLLNSDRRASQRAIVAGFSLMIASNLLILNTAQWAAASGLRSSDRWLKKAVLNDKNDWRRESQIVVLLPESNESPRLAYPVFSVAYLHLLTGRRDLFALIGKPSEANAWPFAEKLNVNGEEKYWISTEGSVKLMHLAGLRLDRPLYVYAPGKNGRPKLMKRVGFLAEEGLLVANAGENTLAAPAESMDALCEEVGLGRAMMWPFPENSTTSEEGLPARALEYFSSASEKDEKKWELSVPTGSRVDIEFTLEAKQPVSSDIYSETNPPMPLLTPFLAVYQTSSGYRITDLVSRTSRTAKATNGQATIGISGYEGCITYLTINGTPAGVLATKTLSGEWQWGRGFKDRYWQGKVLVDGGLLK